MCRETYVILCRIAASRTRQSDLFLKMASPAKPSTSKSDYDEVEHGSPSKKIKLEAAEETGDDAKMHILSPDEQKREDEEMIQVLYEKDAKSLALETSAAGLKGLTHEQLALGAMGRAEDEETEELFQYLPDPIEQVSIFQITITYECRTCRNLLLFMS